MFIPNIVAGWWSLFSVKPMIPTIAKWMGSMNIPDISINWFSWITVPLGLAMWGYITYLARKARSTMNSSQKTLESLKEQLRPKLKVNFKPGKRPWVLDKQPTSSRQHFIFGIELMNSGLEYIQDPKVRLLEIHPSPDDNFIVPDELQLDTKDIQKTDKEGQGEIVEVFEYEHYFGEGTDHLVMIGSIKNKGLKMLVQKYKFKIKVSTTNGGDITKHFEFDSDKKDAKYCMEMID